jgi:hypothetical protein
LIRDTAEERCGEQECSQVGDTDGHRARIILTAFPGKRSRYQR